MSKIRWFFIAVLVSPLVIAQDEAEVKSEEIVDDTIAYQVSASNLSVDAQKKVESLDEEAKKLYYEYKDTLAEYKGLKTYDDQLEQIIFAQEDEIENIASTNKMIGVIDNLNISQDVKRLAKRKKRTGKVALRGRTSKIGKSALFVVSNSEKISKACSGIPGIDVCSTKNLSVLNLAPGGSLIRLTVFSKKAIEEISQIKSNHLELMVTLQ